MAGAVDEINIRKLQLPYCIDSILTRMNEIIRRPT